MGLFGGDSGGGGEFDSQEYRDQYDKINKQYQKIYSERMPILKDYERNSQEQLHALISQTAPQAAGLFAQANKLTAASNKNLADAQGYDTKERRTQERGRAMTDIGVAADAARTNALDRLESYGIDPSQTRSTSLDAGLQLEKALQQTKAATDAETGVEERGRKYVNDALGVSQGALGAASNASAVGTNMMSNNVGATNDTTALYANIFGTPMQNLGAQTNINSLKLQAKQAEQASKAAAGGGSALGSLGSLAGMAGGGYLGFMSGGGMGALKGASMGGALGGQAGGALGQVP
jgi:hypothetical protein